VPTKCSRSARDWRGRSIPLPQQQANSRRERHEHAEAGGGSVVSQFTASSSAPLGGASDSVV
jgi:hypothetical protein